MLYTSRLYGDGRRDIAGWTEGEQFGRFTLRRELGAGAFAEVWLAVEESDLGFRKEVALKLLRATDGDKVQALQQEARLVAALRHPNIVDVLAVEQIAGTWTVVMEYVDGGTLEGLIDRVVGAGLTLPASVVLDLGLDIARALDRAHNATDADGNPTCILHRDLKPANILVDVAGVAKLTDFGVAKVVGDAAATATGTAKGTPAYIAPESWAGGRDFAPTVDLFGLGCILYELVTLQRLFDGEAITVIFWQMVNRTPAEEVAPLQEALPGLVPIVEKLLAREPAERYQSAAEVEDDLVALRGQVGPSGHLSQFLKLLAGAEEGGAGEGRRKAPKVPETGDIAWRELVARATGKEMPAPSPTAEIAPGLADTELMPGVPDVGESIAGPGKNRSAAGSTGTSKPDRPARRSRAGTDGTTRRSGGVRRGKGKGSKGLKSTGIDRRRRQDSGGKKARAPSRKKEAVDTTGSFRVPRGVLLAILVATGIVGAALVGLILGRGSPTDSTEGPVASPAATEVVVADAGATPAASPTATVTPRRSPSPGHTRTPAPTPRPTAEQQPTPTPVEATTEPVEEATAEPTPEPPNPTPEEVTPEPAQPTPTATPPVASGEAPDKACLVTTSTPARASVWIDGAPQSRRALSAGSSMGARVSPGWVTVGMGTGERPTAWLDVELVLGRSATVHCDLGTNFCTSSTGDFGACRQ